MIFLLLDSLIKQFVFFPWWLLDISISPADVIARREDQNFQRSKSIYHRWVFQEILNQWDFLPVWALGILSDMKVCSDLVTKHRTPLATRNISPHRRLRKFYVGLP